MRNVVLQILVVSLLAISISAQIEKPKPILVDEFVSINAEETFARIDSLNSELSKNAGAKVLIRIYGGGENCFLCHYRQGSYITAILKSRRYPLDKYSIEYCNENKELRTQLYLMSTATTFPNCNQTLEIPKHSVLFDAIYFFFNNKLAPLDNTLIESISAADGEYSLKALKAIEKILYKSPGSKIYIIVYLGTNKEEVYEDKNGNSIEKIIRKLDNQTIAKKLFFSARNELIKNGIKPSQIETVSGGYIDGKRKLQFWFVPKGGEIPKPKPDYFPKKNQKTKANKF